MITKPELPGDDISFDDLMSELGVPQVAPTFTPRTPLERFMNRITHDRVGELANIVYLLRHELGKYYTLRDYGVQLNVTAHRNGAIGLFEIGIEDYAKIMIIHLLRCNYNYRFHNPDKSENLDEMEVAKLILDLSPVQEVIDQEKKQRNKQK